MVRKGQKINRKVQPGKSVAEMHPELIEEWSPKNETTPYMVSYGSGVPYLWICKKCGNEYPASPNKRHNGRGCAVCAGQKVMPGYNDLATLAPLLAADWDYEKNTKTPSEVPARGGGPAYWKCAVCGHRWGPVNISSRYRGNGTGCPKCQKIYHTSLPEQIIFYYVRALFPDAINGFKADWLGKHSEIDIYIPSIRMGIEYDGNRWHKDHSTRDREKGEAIQEHGIRLIRIREEGLDIIDDGSESVFVKDTKTYNNLQTVIEKLLLDILGKNFKLKDLPKVDIQKDIPVILARIAKDKKEKSIAYLNPELIKEWDFEANGDLRPEQVTAKGDTKVYWKCAKCGHRWPANVGDRNRGSGCPACANRVIIKGRNDLCSQYPQIAAEWNIEKNKGIDLASVGCNDNRDVYWRCSKCGYEWPARVADRTEGSGCPHCSGRKPLKGVDDLQTLRPDIAIDWDNLNNNGATPDEFRVGSNYNAAWKCHRCGHTWNRPIVDRTRKGAGCLMCARKQTGLKKRIRNYCARITEEHTTCLNITEIGNQLEQDILAGDYKHSVQSFRKMCPNIKNEEIVIQELESLVKEINSWKNQ